MSYKISKISLIDINSYLETLNRTKKKNSLIKKKINRLDHYNWWFKNIKLNKYCLIKNKKKIIYFWQKKLSAAGGKYFFSGWWPIDDKLEIIDFITMTKILLKNSKKHIHVAIISKQNRFSIKLHHYFKFQQIKKSSKIYNEILNVYYEKTKIPFSFLIMIKEN